MLKTACEVENQFKNAFYTFNGKTVTLMSESCKTMSCVHYQLYKTGMYFMLLVLSHAANTIPAADRWSHLGNRPWPLLPSVSLICFTSWVLNVSGSWIQVFCLFLRDTQTLCYCFQWDKSVTARHYVLLPCLCQRMSCPKLSPCLETSSADNEVIKVVAARVFMLPSHSQAQNIELRHKHAHTVASSFHPCLWTYKHSISSV